MKILICYFSGTGNTKKVVERYAECLTNEHGAQVTLFPMEKEFSLDVNDYDLLGIGYPIHAFNAPSIVLDFCRKLPRCAEKKRAFIVNTSGEPLKLNNISSIKTIRILKKRNIVVENEYHYCMPYNMIFRHGDHMAYNMWNTASQLVPIDARDIVNNLPHRLSKVFMGGFIAWIMRCEHWGGRFNGRMFKTGDACSNCQMCVKICPARNIKEENGKIKFGKKCLMCMRCAHLCPRNAIQTGWFNGWKVNGMYSFEKPQTKNDEHYNKMLTKAYKKYFDECEARIASNSVSEREEVEKAAATVADGDID